MVDKNKEQLEEIEYHGERQLDMINKHLKAIQKQEKQIKKNQRQKKMLLKSTQKSGIAVLLNDSANEIIMAFNMSVTKQGEVDLKNLVIDERMINCNNLFLKQVIPVSKTSIFQKDFVHCIIY